MEYPEQHTPSLKQVTWHEIEADVKQVNPELHDIICELDPGPEYRLYVGEYPYGCQTLHNGKFYVPSPKNGMIPIDDHRVNKQIQEDLTYNRLSNPVTLILKNSFEIFINNPIPNTPAIGMLASEGSLFSTSLVAGSPSHHPAFIWDMTSGARSIFMLPKISQAKKYKRLRAELNINTDVPNSNLEHWRVFKDISNSSQSPNWKTKTLIFSENWFKTLNDKKWLHLKLYLLDNFRKTYDALGNLYIWDMLFCLILQNKQLRPSLYTNNTVKHLFQIYMGICPGISPANNEKQAPISYLQKVFIDIYGLKEYIPTIMTPQYFSHTEKTPVYYSLQISSLLDTPKKKDNSSCISDLYEISSLLSKYLNDIKEEKFNIDGTPFNTGLPGFEITPLHPSPQKYRTIKSTENEIKNDKRFEEILYKEKKKEERRIALHSSLLNGCFKFHYK